MNSLMEPGKAAPSGALTPGAQPDAGDGMPMPIPALIDGTARRQRWAQAWDGASGLAAQSPSLAGAPTWPSSLGGQGADTNVGATLAHEAGAGSELRARPGPTPDALTDAAPAATRTLAEWRSRHARPGADVAAAAAEAGVAARHARRPGDGADAAPLAQAAMPWPAAPAPAGPVQGEPAPQGASAADELRGLVESCCSRVLVAPAGAGAAPGVLLDLGRWMPGCSIEVARAAGVLRLTLRGAAVERRAGLADSLGQLRDELSHSLGCPVVLAIDDAPDGSRR